MKVNLRNILLISHENATQRLFYVQPISEYQFDYLDIYFYSEDWQSYYTMLTKSPGLSVIIDNITYNISSGSLGSSSTNPIIVPYVATGADRTWINIFDNDTDTLITTSYGWGNSEYGGPEGIGWGGVAPDDDDSNPSTKYYLDDIICVIQPSLTRETEIIEDEINNLIHGINW
jgi:hypothetical protein